MLLEILLANFGMKTLCQIKAVYWKKLHMKFVQNFKYYYRNEFFFILIHSDEKIILIDMYFDFNTTFMQWYLS